MKQCSYCASYFDAAVTYQVYCTSGCRDLAMKEKIADRHRFLRRQKRKDRVRLCQGKCGTRLSIYNDYSFCDNCRVNKKEVNKQIKQIRMLMHEYEDNTES